MRTISDDNTHISLLCHWQFYHSTQVEMSKISSTDLWFQQLQHAKMTLPFHLLWASSVISLGCDGRRFICFGELPLKVNVFGAVIRESRLYADLMSWRGTRGTLEKVPSREDECCLTSTPTPLNYKKQSFSCIVSGVISIRGGTP